MSAKDYIQKPAPQAMIGLILLAVAGVAGGQIAGFKVEPEACNECGKQLAACEARDALIVNALSKAEAALIQAYQECN
tara:strand:+ start:142 stop:375 length:234 start_codon:yes stop_codon:yes gene_type:complete